MLNCHLFSDTSPQHQLHSSLANPGNALRPHFRPPLGAPEHRERSGPNQRRPVCESEFPVLIMGLKSLYLF